MAERHRSNDGSKDTDEYLSDTEAAGQKGRSGGNLQRDVATQDEKNRAEDDKPGVTRVTGQDDRNHGEDE